MKLAPWLLWLSLTIGAGAEARWLVGAGIYDITGSVAEQGMMGYGQLKQKTAGLHTRLWSRAFYIESLPSHHHAAVVTSDLCFITQAVKLEVVRRLQAQFGPELFTVDNVLLLATHNHAGPGGFSHYMLYNLSSLGFSPTDFEIIVEGIVYSISRAYENREAARLSWARGTLDGAQINRSVEPFLNNPEANGRASQTNKEMTLLKFSSEKNQEIGLLNWFAVHGTSLGNQNDLVSSDNKGLAALEFEKSQGANPLHAKSFVAAFANSEEGDVSPHVEGFDHPDDPLGFKNLEQSASLQLTKAQELWHKAQDLGDSELSIAHRFVRMPSLEVDKKYLPLGFPNQRLCSGAMGISFAAGADDGPGGFGVPEGIKLGDPWKAQGLLKFLIPLIKKLGVVPVLVNDPCQGAKPVLLGTGQGRPAPWTPDVLPIQILKIGPLGILAVPAEFTTISGDRLKRALASELKKIGVTHLVIGGLANAYSSYVATPEEFSLQSYEGASTQFGPWTLNGYIQEFDGLAQEMVRGEVVPSEVVPPDLSRYQHEFQPGVIVDNKHLWESFGQVLLQPKSSYKAGDWVEVKFRSAHPKNNPMTMQGFLEIQREEKDGSWKIIAYDWDHETIFRWTRDSYLPAPLGCFGCSTARIRWQARSPGAYFRIVHRGWRKSLAQRLHFFSGVTRKFYVE